jgi:hypothetical protein
LTDVFFIVCFINFFGDFLLGFRLGHYIQEEEKIQM